MENNVNYIYVKNHPWMEIITWGIGIASVVFILVWMRVRLFESYSGSVVDEIFLFTPHILMFTFGLFSKMLIRIKYGYGNTHFKTLYQIFYPVLISSVIFSVMLAIWTARPNHLVLGRSQVMDIISHLFLTIPLSIFWIIFPFLVGYALSVAVKFLRTCLQSF